MSSRNKSHIVSLILILLAVASPLTAQDTHFDGLHVSGAGSVTAGYAADLGSDASGSDHSLSLGGIGTLNGYYYNPGFIAFQATPYYGRSQSSSDSGSISDNSGYNSSINVFGGSHIPGNISFNQNFDSTGVYGIPGSGIGLDTQDSNRSFAAGWSFIFPQLPSLSVGYGNSSGTSSVLGSSGVSNATSQMFSLHSGYRVWGFNLTASYNHTSFHSENTGFLLNTSGNTTSDSLNFITGHSIPRGAVNVSLGRSSYSSTSAVGTESGTSDNINASLGSRVWILPVTVGASYLDNLYGAVEEQLLANGGTFLLSSSTPETRAVTISASTSYTVLRRVFVTGYITRQEEYIGGGQGYGLTQYGMNASYNFGKRFKGLTITIGALDSANAAGNTGASMLANVNYRRNFGPWEVSANFEYNQQVATLFALYTTSSLNYGGTVTRKLKHGFRMSAGAGGGHSGFNQTAGDVSHAESLNGSLGWRQYGLAGNYSKSSGQSVLTPTGLVIIPVPIFTSDQIVVFDGQGTSFSAYGSPVRSLAINLSYTKSNSTSTGATLNSTNQTELYYGYMTYRFRKLFFNSGVTKFRQSVSGQGVAPSVVTSYYFGVSRWFNFF